MEPNLNMGTTPVQTAPVQAEPVQTDPIVPKDSIVQDSGKEKGGKGAVVGMIIFAILALGGIGFGVWAWMDGNTQKDALNTQISTLKQQNEELAEKINDGDTIINIDTDGNEINTADYIYVGEWGIKIKIPETLSNVSYVVDSWDEENFAGTSLCVTGATTGHDTAPSFVKFMLNGGMYVCLSKNTKSLSAEDGGVANQTFPVGEFYVQGPQTTSGDESDEEWEVESAEALKAMLNDEANRSTI